MSKNEELEQLLQENAALREEVAQLKQKLKAPQDRQAKASHNSSLPPSSDQLFRLPKSLRKPSGKRPGGQRVE